VHLAGKNSSWASPGHLYLRKDLESYITKTTGIGTTDSQVFFQECGEKITLEASKNRKEEVLALAKESAKPNAPIIISEGDDALKPLELPTIEKRDDLSVNLPRSRDGGTTKTTSNVDTPDLPSEPGSTAYLQSLPVNTPFRRSQSQTIPPRPQVPHVPFDASHFTAPSSFTASRLDRYSPKNPSRPRYILLCVSQGTQIRLRQVEISPLWNDEALFRNLRDAYDKVHRARRWRWRSWLLGPQTMRYVKLELVQRVLSGECVGNIEFDSIPPPKEVSAENYEYSPCPPRVGRFPLDPHLFMHSFLRPRDHMGSVGLTRLPKKLYSPLRFVGDAAGAGQPEGWGIYIVEGYRWSLFRRLGFVAILSFSVLTVLWCALTGDVQGGTGAGSFSVTLLGVLLMVLFLGVKVAGTYVLLDEEG
jgi:hypothetical protein